jgi:hypothetical protein
MRFKQIDEYTKPKLFDVLKKEIIQENSFRFKEIEKP